MGRYNSARELAQKMDYEGGLTGMVFGYGLRKEDIPDDVPPEIRLRLHKLINMEPLVNKVEAYFNEQAEAAPRPGDYDYDD